MEKTSAHHRAQRISNILKNRGLEDEALEWEGWRLGNLAQSGNQSLGL